MGCFVMTCPTCGTDPCFNPGFCKACRSADRKVRGKPGYAEDLARNVSLERAWAELNDSRNRPTPKTTIEAVMHAVRNGGLGALKEPTTIERLSRCDAAAKTEIEQRIANLQGRKPCLAKQTAG
jgi:hypothetical protein